jgi:hypothetical protein
VAVTVHDSVVPAGHEATVAEHALGAVLVPIPTPLQPHVHGPGSVSATVGVPVLHNPAAVAAAAVE